MAKWADWCISCVTMDSEGKHIVSVGVRADGDTSISNTVHTFTRGDVISRIEKGETFVTVVWNAAEKKWSRGALVEVIVVNRVKYIKTDANQTARDNLDNLPSC